MKSKAAFQLYPNILESICTLGDKNLVILIRELNHLIAQIDVDDCAKVERFCDDFAQNLNQKGCVFAQFSHLRPQIIRYWENVINGNKGREFGKLGGAPKGNKNATKKQPPYNINDNINDNGKKKIEGVSPPHTTTENVDFDRFVDYFNEYTNELFGKLVKPLSDERKHKIVEICKKYGKNVFKIAYDKALDSDYLRGINSGRPMTFDWMVEPNNFEKILSGNYDNREGKSSERDNIGSNFVNRD